jgi:hypothetical protein
MEDPVMDLCAHTFERSAILEWLNNNNNNNNSCCPISRKPLTELDLRPNHALSERMDCWKFHHCMEKDGILRVVPMGTTPTTTTLMHMVDDEKTKQEKEDTTSTCSLSDDSTDRRRRRPAYIDRTQSKRKRVRYYQAVLPSEFMLLPQERQVLARFVQGQRAEQEQGRRKTFCYSTWLACSGSAVVLGLVAAIYMYVQSRRDDE